MKIYSILLLSLIVVIMTFACGNASKKDAQAQVVTNNDPLETQKLYNAKCAICHGEDGKLGYANSKDLTLSILSRDEVKALITYGKTTMPPQQNILTPEQIEQLTDYTLKLRVH